MFRGDGWRVSGSRTSEEVEGGKEGGERVKNLFKATYFVASSVLNKEPQVRSPAFFS